MEHITTAEAAAFVSAQPPSVQLEPPSAHECDRYFLVVKAPDPYAPCHRFDRDDARSSSARRSRRITSSTTATRSSKCVRFEPFRMGKFVQLQRTRHAEGRPRRTCEEWRVASGSRSPLRVTVATRAALRRALTTTIRSDRDDARRRATTDWRPPRSAVRGRDPAAHVLPADPQSRDAPPRARRRGDRAERGALLRGDRLGAASRRRQVLGVRLRRRLHRARRGRTVRSSSSVRARRAPGGPRARSPRRRNPLADRIAELAPASRVVCRDDASSRRARALTSRLPRKHDAWSPPSSRRRQRKDARRLVRAARAAAANERRAAAATANERRAATANEQRAATANERRAATASERRAATANERRAATANERLAATAKERRAATANERRAVTANERRAAAAI